VTDDFADTDSLQYSSGDDDLDNNLDVTEIWTYTATHTVTQDEMNAGADLKNTAIADTFQTDEKSDSVSTPVLQNPHISLNKITGDGVDGAIVDGDGVQIMAGSNVTWTYTLQNDGNVDINFNKSTGIVDDNGTVGNTSDDFKPTYQTGDQNNDDVLNLGETWIFSASGNAIAGNYTNQATATTDFNNNSVTASDDSSYFGTFTPSRAGLTQGFWGTHTQAWDGSTTNNAKWQQLVGTVLRAAEINPRMDGSVLIGDLNGNGNTDTGENTLLISKAIAQNILSSSVVSDNRISMLQQTIAAQLNIYNGDKNPGSAWNPANLSDKAAGDLITEAVVWLKAYGGSAFSDSNIDSADYTISAKKGGSFNTLLSASQGKEFWTTTRDVDGTSKNIQASGEDLKNVLEAFNKNKLVTMADGTVGWNSATNSETALQVVGAVASGPDGFWAVAHDGIISSGGTWHG
jgi:hypothetical protein